jgi:hypothetical protein
MTNVVQYSGSNISTADTNRGPSPQIWGDCPWLEILSQTGQGSGGYCLWDDFILGGITPAITTAIDLTGGTPYSAFGSAGATITYDDVAGGAIVLTEATDGESVTMYTEQHPFSITQDAGQFWFEARIKVGDIVTLANSFLIGLMDTTTPTDIIPLTASGVTADVNYVGFMQPEGDTTTFNASYKANGVTEVEVNGAIGALVADTYVKLGMIFDPSPATTGTANQMAFYINGVRQASFKTIPDNTGTDFPADIRMGPVVSLAVGAGAATDTLTMDWWRYAQLDAGVVS